MTSRIGENFTRVREANAHRPRTPQGMPTPVNHIWEVKEPGMWKMEVEAFHDSKENYLSHPDHSMVNGMQDTSCVSRGKSLTKLAKGVFQDRGMPNISSANPEMQAYFIPHSATPQYDIQTRVTLDPRFARAIGVRTDGLFDTAHVFLKNGLNGAVVQDVDGSFIELDNCQAGSWDRESPNLQMARKVSPLINGSYDPCAKSYYYTGRPDTDAKALEQAKMIYLSELKCEDPKGIVEEEDGIPTFYYVVNSVQGNTPLYALGKREDGREGVEQEQQYVENEKTALAKLELEPQTFLDPTTGVEHTVNFKPMLFSRQINIAAHVETALDSFHAGDFSAIATSRTGWKELKDYYESYQHKIPEERQELAEYLVKTLEHNYNGRLIGAQMHAAEELSCRAMLCILLKLPVVYHCKSSTDRTSLVGALDETLNQWIAEDLDIPEKFEEILDEPAFKEIFWINWSKAAQFSRNGRSPVGIIEQNGFIRENDHEAIGLSLNSDVSQSVLLEKYLPESMLKSYGISGFLKQFSWKYLLAFPLVLAFGWLIGLGLSIHSLIKAPIGTLGAPKHWYARWPYMVLATIGMFFFNWMKYTFLPFSLLTMAPKKVIDFDHPAIGPRRHLKEAKTYQRPFARPLEAVPANADRKNPEALASHMHSVNKQWDKEKIEKKQPEEIYNLFFEKRFCQEERPIRYFMKGNLLERMEHEEVRVPPKKFIINGKTHESLGEVHGSLIRKGVSRAQANRIIRMLDLADNLSAYRYLQKTVVAPDLKVDLSNPDEENTEVRYDTRTKTLTIRSQVTLTQREGKQEVEHGTIHTETVINTNPKSDDYGQGYVAAQVLKYHDGTWDFTPIS